MSQYNQDHIVAFNIYGGKRDGFFVELGAHDGITLSNTLMLEKKLGWNGVCIEANPRLFQQLNRNRSCICSGELPFSEEGLEMSFSDGDLLGGITESLDKYHHVKNSSQFILKTTTLTKILDNANAPNFIEYFSLDTEGSEYDILKGIDFLKYTFGFISLEHNFVEPRRTEMKNFLYSKGYTYYGSVGVDDLFIHESIIPSTPASPPPTQALRVIKLGR